MSGSEHQITAMIFMTGTILIATMLVKLLFERIGISPAIGYLLLGFAIRAADTALPFMPPKAHEIMRFLALLGVITLLFKAGLESELRGLLSQLRRASIVWSADVLVSGMLGYLAARYLLQFAVIPSLFVATAFTATSVGVSIAVWQECGAISSKNGELLLDVAELDDLSAVVMMAMLFSLAPLLHGGGQENMLGEIAGTIALFFLKIAGFFLLCYFFASFAEHPVVHFFRSLSPPPLPMLTVVGIGLVIAGMAGLLGFSAAIGAFFAGLVFSRDPEAVKMEASFLPHYQFFSPFFFIGIGLDISPAGLEGAAAMGAVLFLIAAAGKFVANLLPIWLMKDLPAGLLVGVSMIPRAEISMIVMQRGLQLGEWAVPQKLFGAMAMVTILTCSVSPLAIRTMLQKWPQQQDK